MHLDHIDGYDWTMKELPQSVTNLKYDTLAKFFYDLAENLYRDSEADMKRGRPQLANQLYCAAEHMYNAANNILEAWKICEPHMNDKLTIKDENEGCEG